ncbi:uncharacterized protein KZ484_024327 [Pholidichthys leucotaenia]
MNSTENKLAELIREHPNLYDQSRRDYKDNMKGHMSWLEIAAAMGKSEEEVKLKWKNLRDKFCKAKKRVAKRKHPRLDDSESPVERPPLPVLCSQLAWLSAYVKPRGERAAESPKEVQQEAVRADQPEEDKEQKTAFITTSFSFADSCSSNHQDMGLSVKRKRKITPETEMSSADAPTNLRDEDELFLLSLLPSMKRLTNKKRMEVRMKFQQVLYAAEFED